MSANNKQTNQGSMCTGGSAELHGDRVWRAMHQSMWKGFRDTSERQKSTEVDNARSYSDRDTPSQAGGHPIEPTLDSRASESPIVVSWPPLHPNPLSGSHTLLPLAPGLRPPLTLR